MLTDKRHFINLSTHGTFQPSGDFVTTPQDVDALFAHLAQKGPQHLALYFHGGLVDEKQGLTTAATLMKAFKDSPGLHPVFVIWESGWWETARRNLGTIQNEPIFKVLLEMVIKFVLGKLTQSDDSKGSKLDLPLTNDVRKEIESGHKFAEYDAESKRQSLSDVTTLEEEQFRDLLSRDPAFRNEVGQIVASLVPADAGRSAFLPPQGSTTGSPQTLMSGEVLDQLKADVDEGKGFITTSTLITLGAKVLGRVITRLLKRTDHGVYCTTIEELLHALYLDSVGAWLWKGMKTATQKAFANNDNLSGTALHGGTYLLTKIRDYIADPTHPPLQVSLVGHSAGGIYICQMLAKAAELMPPSFRFKDVLLLAPGCDFELFKANIIDRADRFENFRMFSLRDEFETQDPNMPVVYPRSLLYFVSGVLEGDEPKPLVGLQRCYSGQPPYDSTALLAVRAFITKPGANRVVWGSVDENAPPGFLTAARGHGEFADALTWQSIVHLLTL